MTANEVGDVSRRRLLRGGIVAACAASAAVALIAVEARAETRKMSQKQASYQPTPKGHAACNRCTLFIAPSGCQVVEGNISPNGWCSLFVAK